MEVTIVDFPETAIAVVEYVGPPEYKMRAVEKLIAWRIENRMSPENHRTYGIYYDDPRTTPAAAYRFDVGISVQNDVAVNPYGVIHKVIPGGRCAMLRHYGSRQTVKAAEYIYEIWFPQSGESLRNFPVFFHYVNVGPQLTESELLTDVYLPIL